MNNLIERVIDMHDAMVANEDDYLYEIEVITEEEHPFDIGETESGRSGEIE